MLARRNSEVQKFIFEMTSKDSKLPVAESGMTELPSLEGISLESDAKKALAELHEEGADTTELIVPKVLDVCELESDGIYVLNDGDDYYDVALTKVDVEHGRYGKYVFYKMQVIHDPIQRLYVLLTNWGRIGEQGKFQQTPFSSCEECIKEFTKIFKSKSGNGWGTRKEFERKSKKYNLVQTVRTRVKDPAKIFRAILDNESVRCDLDKSLAETLSVLLDVKVFQEESKKLTMDQTMLPVVKLSGETLDMAEEKLREIHAKLNAPQGSNEVEEIRSNLENIAKLTNEFYELLPSGDQVVSPFVLNDHRFDQAVEMIRLLKDMSVTKQLLLGGFHLKDRINPLEYAYRALQVRMEPLHGDSNELRCLQRYIDSTCDDDVVVTKVFSLDNGKQLNGEIGNRQLLFHGSKNVNVLGILKQGLRIAPPEAPRTGLAFGKGVYFSDQFSKALSYSSRLSAKKGIQPRAFVFVAEVALGIPFVAMQAQYMENPRDGTNSTFAPATSAPDSNRNLILNASGAIVPLGELKKSQLPQAWRYKWTTGRSWRDISAEDSKRIEDIRNDGSTKFPAEVRVTYQSAIYTAVLGGPFAEELIMAKLPSEESGEDVTMRDLIEGKTASNSNSTGANLFCSDGNFGGILPNDGVKLTRTAQSGNFQHSEFIVYDTNQIQLRYLVELTSPSWIQAQYGTRSPDDDEDNNPNFGDVGAKNIYSEA